MAARPCGRALRAPQERSAHRRRPVPLTRLCRSDFARASEFRDATRIGLTIIALVCALSKIQL